MKSGDRVYVSDTSISAAIEKALETNPPQPSNILVAEIPNTPYPFICVADTYEAAYKAGKQFDTVEWSYCVTLKDAKCINKEQMDKVRKNAVAAMKKPTLAQCMNIIRELEERVVKLEACSLVKIWET